MGTDILPVPCGSLIEGTVDETATVKVNGQPAQTASAPGSGQMAWSQ
jgi:hypothetical protein